MLASLLATTEYATHKSNIIHFIIVAFLMSNTLKIKCFFSVSALHCSLSVCGRIQTCQGLWASVSWFRRDVCTALWSITLLGCPAVLFTLTRSSFISLPDDAAAWNATQPKMSVCRSPDRCPTNAPKTCVLFEWIIQKFPSLIRSLW